MLFRRVLVVVALFLSLVVFSANAQNPCETQNGGCDYHVTCTYSQNNNIVECGPCPLGYNTVNNTCIALCGDGLCDASENEDCVTCPMDCRTDSCGVCGDGTCSNNENCTSCFLDCGRCVYPACNCQNEGVCSGVLCFCKAPWTGPSCTERTKEVIVTMNSTTPQISMSSENGQTTFDFSFSAIYEKTPENVVTKYESTNVIVSFEQSTQADIYRYTISFENAANATFSVYLFKEETSITFADETLIYAPKTVKLNLQVVNWPFKSIQNTLDVEIRFSASLPGKETCKLDTKVVTNSDGSANYFTSSLGTDSVYGLFSEYSLIDDRIRRTSFYVSDTDQKITATLSHFFASAEINSPSFFVTNGTTDTCNDTPTKGPVIIINSTDIPLPTVPAAEGSFSSISIPCYILLLSSFLFALLV